jgi:hypothetical protein
VAPKSCIIKKEEQILAKMEERMTVTQAKTDVKLRELTEPSPEMMQSVGEHQ